MNKHAIFHIPDIPYVYAVDDETLLVRIRAAKNDIKRCELYYKDRYDWENPYETIDMIQAEGSELFEFYEASIKIDEKRYRYLFKLEDMNGEIIYLNERGLQHELKEPIEASGFQFPYLNSADVYKGIKWAQEGTIYQIFPDRFCNGDKSNDPKGVLPWGDEVTTTSMFGGDLQGIIDKIPYIHDLGIDIIYLTPIFLSTTNHKYNTCDYYKIDPSFGDLEKAKELVEKCHEKGIKILFDAVFNHSGSDFFAFKDVIENGEKSKFKDWFFIKEFPVDTGKVNYITFANNVSQMPKLNTANPEVIEYLLGVAEYWIKEIGIDGWRLDVCDEVDHAFWREFRKVVKKANPDAIIVGEIMHEASAWLRGDQLDSIMNYPFKGLMVDFFAKRDIDAAVFDDELALSRSLYMGEINKNLLNLIGSHDTARFLTECEGDIARMKLAIAFQFTYIGIPYIYYGDEVGINGGHDPKCRKCMIWDEEKQQKDLHSLYKKLNNIRKNNKSLVYGEYINLFKEGSVLVYKRVLNDEEIICIINNSDSSFNLKLDCLEGEYLDLINDNRKSLSSENQLESNEFMILKVIK